MSAPFGGEMVIADPSAINRADHPLVSDAVAAAFNARQIVTCVIVMIELFYSARDADELADVEATQSSLSQRVARASRLAVASHGAGGTAR